VTDEVNFLGSLAVYRLTEPLMPAWLAALLTRKMLICVFTGFSSGLPLYLLLNLLPAWLRSEGVDLKTIGFFALIQFPYTWKFLWSPLLDRFSVPGFGRRRGWMLVTQVGLLFAIGSLGGLDPARTSGPSCGLPRCSPSCPATQDIAVDAFRREILSDNELGLGNAVHVNAYRIAGLIPGSLSLILADRLPWNEVFWITGAFMIPGMVMAWLVSEPLVKGAPKTLRQAVTEPFPRIHRPPGLAWRVMVLGFIFLYKLGDSLCTALATPFYLDMGFTKTDIGLIAKHAGLWPAVIGALLGGLWMVRLGINRALWLFGVVQLVSIFGFAWLAAQGHYDSIGAGERWRWPSSSASKRSASGWARRPSSPSSPAPPTRPIRRPRWRCSPAWRPCRAPSSMPRPAGWWKRWAGPTSSGCAALAMSRHALLLLKVRAVERRASH
jgi:PAT family beta-lactamase induction signal transducer AmpG